MRGRGRGGRFRRWSTKHSGIFYPYCMDSVPFNNLENQVIPTGLNDISKSSWVFSIYDGNQIYYKKN